MAAGQPTRWEDRLQGVNFMCSDCAPVKRMADRCGVQPWVVAAAVALWFAGFVLWGFTGEFICTVVGSLYPMYASFKALEDGSQEEVAQWLVYWVTYSMAMLAESLFYRLVCWLPFYHIMRLLFVVWLFFPLTNGAQSAYAWAVGPLLRRYRPTVDGALARSAEELRGTLGGKRNDDIRRAFRSAAAAARSASPGSRRRCGGGGDEGAGKPEAAGPVPVSQELGIEELMAQELAKEAAVRLGKVAAAGAASLAAAAMAAASATPAHEGLAGAVPRPAPAGMGARNRMASPRPACLAPTPPPPPMQQHPSEEQGVPEVAWADVGAAKAC